MPLSHLDIKLSHKSYTRIFFTNIFWQVYIFMAIDTTANTNSFVEGAPFHENDENR